MSVRRVPLLDVHYGHGWRPGYRASLSDGRQRCFCGKHAERAARRWLLAETGSSHAWTSKQFLDSLEGVYEVKP